MSSRTVRTRVPIVCALALAALAGCATVAPAAAPGPSASATVVATATPTATPALTALPRSTRTAGLPVGTETVIGISLPPSHLGGPRVSTQIALAVSDAVWQPAGACRTQAYGEYLTVTIRETVVKGPGARLSPLEFHYVANSGKEANQATFSGCDHPALASTSDPTNGILIGQLTFDVSTGHGGKITYVLPDASGKEATVASWVIP